MPSPNINDIIIRRLDAGRRLPRVIVKLSQGWTGFDVTRIRPVAPTGPDMSPTEFGYRTIVWLGRVMVVVRRKE